MEASGYGANGNHGHAIHIHACITSQSRLFSDGQLANKQSHIAMRVIDELATMDCAIETARSSSSL